jgi:hypothetical protein
MNVIATIIGLFLLLVGRRLFWLFVGGAGFLAGVIITRELIPIDPPWLALVLALLAGVAGALLGLFLQKLAVALAGFAVGGMALMSLAGLSPNDWLPLVLFLAGGILGALLVLFLFEWALIVLSSAAGALLLVRALDREPDGLVLVFLIALISGIAVQGTQMMRARHKRLRVAQSKRLLSVLH